MDYDLIVIGQGLAGLTCAGEAARLGLRVANFESDFPGGLVANVNELHRFDEAQGLSGMDHAMLQARDNQKAGVAGRMAAVTAVRVLEQGFELVADDGHCTARAVVLASGARLKSLGVPGEDLYEGRGVSHCADCDAPMFTDAEVVVAGAGDWALQDALLLAQECAAVHVVHAQAQAPACADNLRRAQEDPRIHWHPSTQVTEVLGDDAGMIGVRLRDATGASRDLPAAGLFVLTGLQPNSALAPEGAARDAGGHLLVNAQCETTLPALWAVGQVRAGFGGWLTDAVADGRLTAQAVKARLG